MTTPPDLLLVHGAWDTLIPELPAGEVRTVALPSSGAEPAALGDFADDVRAVRAGLAASEGRPTVVVAHSFGGPPATEAVCGQPHVVGLICVAAFVADAGQIMAELFDGGSPPCSITTPTAHHPSPQQRPPEGTARPRSAAIVRPLQRTRLGGPRRALVTRPCTTASGTQARPGDRGLFVPLYRDTLGG